MQEEAREYGFGFSVSASLKHGQWLISISSDISDLSTDLLHLPTRSVASRLIFSWWAAAMWQA
jgi:hypothetical protein